ncbi:MAG: hypothetical protein QXP91_11990 [Candidatus Methanomethylicia archaeon]
MSTRKLDERSMKVLEVISTVKDISINQLSKLCGNIVSRQTLSSKIIPELIGKEYVKVKSEGWRKGMAKRIEPTEKVSFLLKFREMCRKVKDYVDKCTFTHVEEYSRNRDAGIAEENFKLRIAAEMYVLGEGFTYFMYYPSLKDEIAVEVFEVISEVLFKYPESFREALKDESISKLSEEVFKESLKSKPVELFKKTVEKTLKRKLPPDEFKSLEEVLKHQFRKRSNIITVTVTGNIESINKTGKGRNTIFQGGRL